MKPFPIVVTISAMLIGAIRMARIKHCAEIRIKNKHANADFALCNALCAMCLCNDLVQ